LNKIYPFIIVPFIFIVFSGIKTLHANALSYYPPNWGNFLNVAEWAKDNLKRNDIVVVRKPELFYFKSDTKTVSFPFTDDLNVLKKYFDE
jgi:hypothetical protein